MLYREINAVCSQIHTKHINTLCGQNAEFLTLNLAVYIVTTGLILFSCILYCTVHCAGLVVINISEGYGKVRQTLSAEEV
jgi:hypothetical protein